MSCTGCHRIRRVLGIRRQVGVVGVNPDKGLFSDGLTIPQKMLHVGLALLGMSLGLWILWVTLVGLMAAADWVNYLLFGAVV